MFLQDFHQVRMGRDVDVISSVLSVEGGFSTSLDAHERLLIFGEVPLGEPQSHSSIAVAVVSGGVLGVVAIEFRRPRLRLRLGVVDLDPPLRLEHCLILGRVEPK